jgi:hypothetical protein
MSDFTLEMLPAREGDCLLLSYEDTDAGRHRHVLIDAGRAGTWPALEERLGRIPDDERELELLVISHVDRDHIEGVLKMLADDGCPVTFKDIWFNGYRHLAEDESFGPVQGEKLTTLLDAGLPWNVAFAKKAVCIPASGELPVVELPGGLRLTVVSPDRTKLSELIPEWEEKCAEAGLDPTKEAPEGIPGDEPFGAINVDNEADTDYDHDDGSPNGSSIGLLAEYDGRKVLLAADAHIDRMSDALTKLGNGAPLELSAWKIAHHGSAGNTSRELLELVKCERYLVSTSGAHFKHPHRIAIARLLKYGGAKEIVFNYRSNYSRVWDDADLKDEWKYEASYCKDGEDGTVVVKL